MIPVADLRFQPVLDGCGRPLDTVERPPPHLLEVRAGKLTPWPTAASSRSARTHPASITGVRRPDLLGSAGPEIQVGRPPGGLAMPSGSTLTNSNRLDTTRRLPAGRYGRQRRSVAGRRAPVACRPDLFVDQHRALPEQAVVALDDQVDRPVEQGMAWRHVLGKRPALDRDEIFLEGHALVPAQEGSAEADLTVPAAQFGRDVADLEPVRSRAL